MRSRFSWASKYSVTFGLLTIWAEMLGSHGRERKRKKKSKLGKTKQFSNEKK
jgi:hypothetical protein